jgi:hypothetical protein
MSVRHNHVINCSSTKKRIKIKKEKEKVMGISKLEKRKVADWIKKRATRVIN